MNGNAEGNVITSDCLSFPEMVSRILPRTEAVN